jgi:predicted transcriptional regulator of viral defense system
MDAHDLDGLAKTVLAETAAESRRVLSNWRIHVLLRRVGRRDGERPVSRATSVAVERRLVERGDIFAVPGVPRVYIVDNPFARALPYADEQLIMEVYPAAFFSHLTALIHHGLTTAIHRAFSVTQPATVADRLPVGTSPEDWEGVPLPVARKPNLLDYLHVVWHRDWRANPGAGVEIASTRGAAIYVTDLERTLLDCLMHPEDANGISNVLRAWRLGLERWDLERLLRYADRGPVWRQRVGFVVERLGARSPTLDEWKTRLQRGGSLKLIGSRPYASTYSSEWNLSLNVADSVLGILDD